MKVSIRRSLASLSIFLIAVLSACDGAIQVTPTPDLVQIPAPTPLPQTLVTFRAEIPAPLEGGETLSLAILDEVVGLAISPAFYPMRAEDATHYFVVRPLPMQGVIKYRYVRQGVTQVEEHVSDGRAVRYRLYLVQGPGTVQDVITRWTDSEYNGPTGRISGKITAEDGAPLPGILVSAGGAQTLSDASGSYLLEGLPPGTHNLVAYAPDGAYHPYQQGAVVAAGSTTPASLGLRRARFVKVTFLLTVPKDTFPAIPIRLAGSLAQLGNTFGDLAGGISASVARMPVLSPQPDGRYRLTLDLPEGAYITYKYTLGDGLWNAEHDSTGAYVLRELIVPGAETQVVDQVISWRSGKSAPITFEVTVPASTPPGDTVFLQLNPAYGWTEPVPMWKIGENRWMYVLFSPLDMVGAIGYRYCRNGLCGSADDARTSGPSARGRAVHTSVLPENVVDEVAAWAWFSGEPEKPITLPNVAIRNRGAGFIAGVELQPIYHPSWNALLPSSFGDIRGMNASWVFLTPTWTFTRNNLPVLEPVAGQDPLWSETLEMIAQAQAQELKIALFPIPRFPGGAAAWWQEGARDFPWWVVWFERYRAFLLHHAELAARQNVSALVVGGDWLQPAMPRGALTDGSGSGVPEDAPERWRNLLQEVRSRYSGALLWALPYPQGVQNPPPFLDAVDQVYVLWSAPLAAQAGANETDMAAEAGRLFDAELLPLQQQLGKPFLLALAYPSARGAAAGCLAGRGGCLDLDALSRPNADLPEVALDLEEQVRAYSAIFLAANERDWISGIVSRGYYPAAGLVDKSTSVHGKPARGVLWYWFPRLRGIIQ